MNINFIYIYSVERKVKAALLTWSWSMCPLGLRDGEGVRGSASKRRSSVWSRFCTCTPIHTHRRHRGRGKKQAASASSLKKRLCLLPLLSNPPPFKLSDLDSNFQIFKPPFRNFESQNTSVTYLRGEPSVGQPVQPCQILRGLSPPSPMPTQLDFPPPLPSPP